MSEPRPAGRSRVNGQLIGTIAIVVLLLAFVLSNRDEVNIDFLVFDINVALIWVLVGTAVLGAAAGFLLGRRSRKD
ncbi:MAG: LapA family protein [Acidimicrobiales bacterium]|nr:LapA family protein [Acidimicrobiales bacterium]